MRKLETRRILRISAAILTVLVAGALPVLSQPSGPTIRVHRVAVPNGGGLDLAFAPKVADGIMLTVSGPQGVHTTHEFAPGEAPTLTLIDDRGPFPDGHYKYELRTQPEVDARLQRIADESDDDRMIRQLALAEKARVIVQAGRFELAGGSIVIPPLELQSEAFGVHNPVPAHEHGPDTHVHKRGETENEN